MTTKAGRKKPQDATVDADQVEASALKLGPGAWAPIYTGISDQLMSGELEEESPGRSNDTETLLEDRVVKLLGEIESRRKILADNYPFVLSEDKTSLQYRGSRSGIYEVCLAIALT